MPPEIPLIKKTSFISSYKDENNRKLLSYSITKAYLMYIVIIISLKLHII